MRRIVIFVIAFLATLASAVLWAYTADQRAFNLRGYEHPLSTTNLPYRVPRLGVNVDLLQYSADELPNALDRIQSSGFVWLRQVIPWDEIEIKPGYYDWTQLDSIARHLDERPALHWLPVFFYTPEWYRPPDRAAWRTAPPEDPVHLAQFSAAFARRYGHLIEYYQIWDEPNLRNAWGGNPQPAAYLAMLAAAYRAIHASDPNAQVMAAALAPTTETGPENISDWIFLRQLYQLGLREYSDAIAGKPYGFDFSPMDRRVQADLLNFSRIVAMREIMLEYGDGQTALWASQWGWNHLPSDWAGEPSIWGAVSEQNQAHFTLEAIARADREWPWLGGLILENWQPNTVLHDARWGFSLVTPGGTDKPLLSALREYGFSQPQAAQNGLFHPVNPYAAYSGLWTFGPLGADIGWLETSDSFLRFHFAGTEAGLLVRKGNYFAFLYPRIDGRPLNRLPVDANGNPYILLRSPTLQPELTLVPVATNLPQNIHVLELVADRGWDQWALAGFAVSDGDPSLTYHQQELVSIFAVVISLIALVSAGFRLRIRLNFLRRIFDFLQASSPMRGVVVGVLSSVALLAGMLLTWGEGIPSIFRRDAFLYPLAFLLSGGLLVLNLGPVLVLVSSALLLGIFFLNALVSVILIVLWLPFFLFPVELYHYAFPISEILFYLALLAWIARSLASLKGSRPRFPSNPADWLVIAYVLLGLMGYWRADYKAPALTELRTLIIQPALFYFLIRSTVRSRSEWYSLAAAFVASGLLVGMIGLVMLVLGQGIVTAEGGAYRLAGVYGSPNNAALYLERCLPFALALSFCLPHARMRYAFLFLVFCLIGIPVILTQSVGALLLGIPAALVTFVIFLFGRRALPYIAVLGASLIFLLTLATLFLPRFSNVWDLSRDTSFFRIRLWESSLDMISDHPVTGLGLDQFLYLYRTHYVKPDAIWDPDLSHPHNIIFDFWIRLGIGGVIFLLILQVWFWRRIIRLRTISLSDRSLRAAAAAAMAAVIAHGLIDNSVFVLDLAYFFFFLVALVASFSSPLIDAQSN